MKSLLASALLIFLAACGESGTVADLPDAEVAPVAPLASCDYANPFSGALECREYLGSGWDEDAAASDCEGGWAGDFSMGGRCDKETILGTCAVSQRPGRDIEIVFVGQDEAECDATRTGCEVFAGGEFAPSAVCGGTGGGGGGGGIPTGTPFTPPTLVCASPVDGEAPGTADGGEVCTWQAISACTEPGRRFADYGSCDTVRTQRPYYPFPPAEFEPVASDPRLEDSEFVDELAWVREQVESCACVCCHSEDLAPSGPSNWFIEAGDVWTDSMGPEGLALAAGWVDSTSFGAYPAEENNGFDRSITGFPTTDPARLAAFFEAELGRRGFAREDFADTEPFGGPLYDQLVYEPELCDDGVGVDAEGAIRWSGGEARYVYILEAGSDNPLTPPNLDLPEGTIFRLDVSIDAEPLASGLRYGDVPEGTRQAFPEAGAPAPLVSGERYYLYVLRDVGIPIARCLFDAL